MQTALVTKFITTGASTGLGTFSSAGVVTGGTATFTTPRRVLVWGSSFLGGNVRITGTSEGGGVISESVASSTVIGAAVETVQDFASVTAVTLSCGVTSTTGYIGTSSHGGTSWNIVDTMVNPTNVGFFVRPTSTTVTATLEFTYDYPQYDVQQGSWTRSVNSTQGPSVITSTIITGLTTAGFESRVTPFVAWRITITSSSSGAGALVASVVQSG